MSGTLNKVILIGNVGADVKVHRFDNNGVIASLPLATSESYISKDSNQRVEQTEWHNIVVRNKLAEVFEKYVKKGDKIYVEGKLKTRKWTDQNGMDRYTTEVIVNEFTFLTPKGNESYGQKTNVEKPEPQKPKTDLPKDDFEDDEVLPF